MGFDLLVPGPEGMSRDELVVVVAADLIDAVDLGVVVWVPETPLTSSDLLLRR